MWPQIIVLVIYFIGLVAPIVKQFSKKKDNAEKADLLFDLLGRMVMLSLLYMGGFFDCFFK